MSPATPATRRDLRHGLAVVVAMAGATLLLSPAVAQLAGGSLGPRRLALTALIVESCFLPLCGAAAGLAQRRGYAMAVMAGAASLALVGLLAAGLAGAPAGPLLIAQAPAAGAFVLGWGLGRLARDSCRRRAAATALALLLVLVCLAGLLPLSHLSPLLADRQWLIQSLLALNPPVAISGSAGFDLVRSALLYDTLTLSGYRFHYPGVLPSTLLPVGLGLVLGRPVSLRRRRSGRRSSPLPRSSRKESLA